MSTGNGEYAAIVDDRSSLPGRGAWLHPVPQCVQQAIRRRALTKALRITGPLDTSGVVEHFQVLDSPGNRRGSKEHEHTVKSR
ncbi:YlxR family protein [Mycobacterium interjectum]|uniref:YlxR family protein n=1 Tax=Mycobacterium interjectum TaxID=33895 RepID=UPI000B2E320D